MTNEIKAKFKLNEDIFLQRITMDSDNNRVIVGYERNTEEDKVLISKYDADDIILWQKKLGSNNSNDRFYAVATDSSNNYIAVGYETSSTSGSNTEALIAKFDIDGNLLWQKKLGSPSSNVFFYAVTTDSTNNYIAVGYEYSDTGNWEALIVKLDADGTLLWQKKLDGSNNDYFHGVTTDSSNNYIAVGYEYSSVSNYEALIAKFDTNGNLLWNKKIVSADNTEKDCSGDNDWEDLISKGVVKDAALNSIQATLKESSLTITDGTLKPI